MIAAGGLSGGLSSTIAGGKFIDGFRQGVITSGLNHVAHMIVNKIQENKTIRNLVENAGYNPDDGGYLGENELVEFVNKVFPELYAEANRPAFEIHDNLVDSKGNSVMGKAVSDSKKIGDKYIIKSGGVIKLAKMSFYTYGVLAGTIGHELVHITDMVSGNYQVWANKYGMTHARTLSEVNAYNFEQKYSAPLYNPSEHQFYLNNMKEFNLKH